MDTTVPIPEKILYIHKNVHLFIDIMFVNGFPFLMSISKNHMYRTGTYLVNMEHHTIHEALDEIFGKFNDAGYKIRHLSADNQFHKALDTIKPYLKLITVTAPTLTKRSVLQAL